MTKSLAIAALIAASALAACGKQGELERPAPLWGAEAKAQYWRDRCAVAATPRDSADPERTALPEGCSNDDVTRSVDPRPARTVPIDGQASDPFETAPAGSLPDPYARPQ